MNAYVYIQSELPSDDTNGLWTVGFYDPTGKWMPVSDHGNADEAAAQTHRLNGGHAARRQEASMSRELDPDEEWGQWFQQKQQNGYVFIDKDEWKQQLDDAAKDGYAEGRSDEREEWRGALEDVLEVLADYEDVIDGDYGVPRPNRAMQIATELRALLGEQP